MPGLRTPDGQRKHLSGINGQRECLKWEATKSLFHDLPERLMPHRRMLPVLHLSRGTVFLS